MTDTHANAPPQVAQTRARAERGDASACFNLGCYHDAGTMGVPVDKRAAITWLTKVFETKVSTKLVSVVL